MMNFFGKIFRPKCDEPRLRELIISDIKRRIDNETSVFRENLIKKYSKQIESVVNRDSSGKYIKTIFEEIASRYLEMIKRAPSPKDSEEKFEKINKLQRIADKNEIKIEISAIKKSSFEIVTSKYENAIEKFPELNLVSSQFIEFKKNFKSA